MRSVVGMFGSVEDGQRARDALLAAGIADGRIVVSASLTDDGLAAEYPGQTYENQDYRSSDQAPPAGGWTDTDRARYATEVRAAACVVSVRLERESDAHAVSELLRRAGARRAIARPGP
ncbi:MAG TPA: hypothetical protein VM489_12135 [Burkholderiales bacterium]|nr:hypothetical protein [Burkholderiales bacterium]